MYYIEIKNDIAYAKGEGQFKTGQQIEISKELFDKITSLPASVTMEQGEIVDITPWPVPLPEYDELRRIAYSTERLIDFEGKIMTVDEANDLFIKYFAEDSANADILRALIIAAKESVRKKFSKS